MRTGTRGLPENSVYRMQRSLCPYPSIENILRLNCPMHSFKLPYVRVERGLYGGVRDGFEWSFVIAWRDVLGLTETCQPSTAPIIDLLQRPATSRATIDSPSPSAHPFSLSCSIGDSAQSVIAIVLQQYSAIPRPHPGRSLPLTPTTSTPPRAIETR